MPDIDLAITGQVQADAISGQVQADDVVGDDVVVHAIKFIDHCDYDKLGCGGTVADAPYTCESVFRVREISTEYVTRWLVSPEYT